MHAATKINRGPIPKSVKYFCFLFLTLSSSMISSAHAAFIDITTLNKASTGGTNIGTPNGGQWAGTQFQVGPDTPLSTITQVTLGLISIGSTPAPLNALTVSIFSDSGGVPSNTPPLADFFNNGTLLNIPTDVVFTSSTPFTLLASTTYWLVFKTITPASLLDTVQWTYNGSDANTPALGINGQINNISTVTTNAGANWDVIQNRYYRFSINVPEPSTYALGLSSLLCIGLVARHKKRRVALLHS